MNFLLVLKKIRKQFDGKVVLNGIDVEIANGEIVSMLGPSGSGKTTLLNIILGLTSMDSGTIIFNDKDISKLSMKERGFNIVFQDYALFPNLNAYKNIIYGVKNRPDLISKEELDGLIDFLELEPHLSKQISQLSGGQKQRVALARTLATKPKILLLDEPLSALDGVIKETIKDRIKAITREYHLTTIIVTHDPEEALTMSDKVLIIDQGKVSQFGTPNQVIHQPQNNFVEEFILRQLRIKRDNIYNLFEGCHA
ncbi:ABC transporter ATP-binding protein [Pelosinus fermentans]|uniref:ABC transporter ATP-binding protein n=1 Tax=Pelosinus fermentans TaxID=365349 RepID=UPI001ED91739|nr:MULTISPECIES: ABC transporter ATP-binding protein [Pelosinus]